MGSYDQIISVESLLCNRFAMILISIHFDFDKTYVPIVPKVLNI